MVLQVTVRAAVAAALAALTTATTLTPASARPTPISGARVPAGPGSHRYCGVLAGPRHSRPPHSAVPLHTLTVRGINLAGKPANGGRVTLLSVDNTNLAETEAFHDGVAKFSIPAGPYFALGAFGASATSPNPPTRLVVLPQFTVTGNGTVTIRAAAATSKITMVTPRPATAYNTDLWLTRTGKSGLPFLFEDCIIGAPLWISPTHAKPTVGTIQVLVNQHLESTPGRGVPYEYTLSYSDPPGTIPLQRYVVRQHDLATVHERFYQAVTSSGGWAFSGSPPASGPNRYFITPEGPARANPGLLTEYAGGSGSARFRWFGQYEPLAKIQPPWSQGDSLHLPPGKHVTESFGAYPLHPGPNVLTDPQPHLSRTVTASATRAGNKLSLDINPFDDNDPGHVISTLYLKSPATITGTYEIDQNGTKIAGGNAVTQTGPSLEFSAHAQLGSAPSTVRFALNLARTSADFPLSTATSTVWTWRSAPKPGATLPTDWSCSPLARSRSCAVQPMMTLWYHVASLALNGSAPAGRQAVHLSVGHLQLAKAAAITHASVSVSFDGGKTWHPAHVTGNNGSYVAVFTAPAGAKVTLRTSAADAAGGTIAETITSAYQIAA